MLTFLAPLLAGAPNRVVPGSPQWCELDDDDPAKLRACLAACGWWAITAEHRQQAEIEASHAIAAAADWATIGRRICECERFYHEKQYLRRTLADE